MIFSLVVPPSELGKLLEECVRVLLETTLGKIQVTHADKESSFPANLIRDQQQHLLVSGNAPSSAIAKQLVECGVPTIALVDDPREIIRHIKTTYQSDFTNYIRTASTCLALTYDLVVDFAQLVLDRRICSMGIRRLIEETAFFYKLPLTEAARLTVLNRLLKGAPGEDCPVEVVLQKRSAQSKASLSRFETRLIDACLGPFGSVARRKPVKRVVWPAALFSPAGDAETYWKQVDMVGRARIVIFGPSLYLPPGHWKATPTFSVDDNDSGNVLVIDVYDGVSLLAEGRCALPREGQFSCELGIEIKEPLRPFEVRFATGQGAIEGTFKLDEVMIERL